LPLLIFLEREKKEEKKARVIGKREKALYNWIEYWMWWERACWGIIYRNLLFNLIIYRNYCYWLIGSFRSREREPTYWVVSFSVRLFRIHVRIWLDIWQGRVYINRLVIDEMTSIALVLENVFKNLF
jgi:hypothetical protein